jgi:hypothetical protein
MKRRDFLKAVTAATSINTLTLNVHAQNTFPSKPIRLIRRHAFTLRKWALI